MRNAPKGRTHSKRKVAKKYLNNIKKYFRWHQAFANRYNITKIKWFNTTVSFKPQTQDINIINNQNKIKQKNWFTRFISNIFSVKKKNQPLVIIGIKHYNNNKNNLSSIKIQYLKKNHWNTVFVSNRTHKLTTIDSQRFTKKINSNAQKSISKGELGNHFETLNQIEKAQALTSILPDTKLDIKYDYYYGTNALKTICIPLISASTDSSSSNEVLELNKDVSLKLNPTLLQNFEVNNEFCNNSHIRKRISKKYEHIVSSKREKFNAKDVLELNLAAVDSKSVYYIADRCTKDSTNFDPFDKSSFNKAKGKKDESE
ncbi:hypothetical protein ACO0R3_002453 [Hanseniaspora guilliermondii]